MDKVRLALIGAGVIGQRHLKSISVVERAELVAIVDTNPAVEQMAVGTGAAFPGSNRSHRGIHYPKAAVGNHQN